MLFKEKHWHNLFEASILIKGVNGLWETISGFALIFITKNTINNTFILLTRKELTEDPQDTFIHFLNIKLQHLSTNTKNFAAIYILVHGMLNMFLAYNLYKNRPWAYLASVIFAVLFILYLLYRVSHTHSGILIGVIVFDILFTILTWHEYTYRKNMQILN